ncbi:hypothetical protein MKW98_019844 [Papaver atlanticum]|uniref:Auxin-responsive protein n=1 Tax=Papaver atlanticum TaxID=357466 RepID=A0AAD4S1S7_9MAGN|nr:hypothetical protein MKW98_019844 [Papaver atlanticum]
MSTPLHGVAEEGLNSSEPKERNYMGLSDSSSDDNSVNLKATELTLGLPGSRSPERDQQLCLISSGRVDELQLFPLLPSSSNTAVLGNKRGIPDAMNGFSFKKTCLMDPSNNTSNNLASKVQVVGRPLIKKGKPGRDPLYVNVSMDNAPYLRKIDLRSYSSFQELSSALEKMFTIGDYCCLCLKLGQRKVRDLLNGSEDVLTYEDKDGDWMLVGEMFIESCKRLRIMKALMAYTGLGTLSCKFNVVSHLCMYQF